MRHDLYECDDGHEWCRPSDTIRHDYCRRCMKVRRADHNNPPCKGTPKRLALREPTEAVRRSLTYRIRPLDWGECVPLCACVRRVAVKTIMAMTPLRHYTVSEIAGAWGYSMWNAKRGQQIGYASDPWISCDDLEAGKAACEADHRSHVEVLLTPTGDGGGSEASNG